MIEHLFSDDILLQFCGLQPSAMTAPSELPQSYTSLKLLVLICRYYCITRLYDVYMSRWQVIPEILGIYAWEEMRPILMCTFAFWCSAKSFLCKPDFDFM